jgi:hypothetical protein
MDGHLYLCSKVNRAVIKWKYKWDPIQWTRGPATHFLPFYYLLAYATESIQEMGYNGTYPIVAPKISISFSARTL